MLTKYKSQTEILLFILLFAIFGSNQKVYAQMDTIQAHQQFESLWYNKKLDRYIEVCYDKYKNIFTINDWAKGGREAADVYYADLKGDKLIIYADNEEHHAPYCELEIRDNQLHYRCNCCLNFTDNFLNTNKHIDEVVFKKFVNHKKRKQ